MTIKLETIVKLAKSAMRMRSLRMANVYIPKLIEPDSYLEYDDGKTKHLNEDEEVEFKEDLRIIRIFPKLPDSYKDFTYGELRKNFHIDKLDISTDDNDITPAEFKGIFVYIKV